MFSVLQTVNVCTRCAQIRRTGLYPAIPHKCVRLFRHDRGATFQPRAKRSGVSRKRRPGSRCNPIVALKSNAAKDFCSRIRSIRAFFREFCHSQFPTDPVSVEA